MATANLFRQGHRICLDITSLDLPTGVAGATNAEYVPYHICSSKTVLHKVYHDRKHPSHLLLPVVPRKARPGTQAAISFLVFSKLSSISTLLGSRKKICQRVLLGTWLTR